jgi:hypothetical protein
MSNLLIQMAQDRTREMRAEAERVRRSRANGRPADPADVVIRRARTRDRDTLVRLEQLEGRRLGRGSVLVAEVGGEVLAALPLVGGGAIADPFRRTAPMVRLLRTHRDALGDKPQARRTLRSFLGSHLRPQRQTAGC